MKYRLWHKKFKKYLLKDEYFVNQNGEIVQIINCSIDYTASIETLDKIESKYIIVEQFVEQLDSNNKEIFEGDLILHTFDASCSYFQGKEIICMPGSYMATKQDIYEVTKDGVKNFLTSKGNHIGLFKNHKYEVIGNVNENKGIIEFLKKKPDYFKVEDWIAEMFNSIEVSK